MFTNLLCLWYVVDIAVHIYTYQFSWPLLLTLGRLFSVIWHEEVVPRQWREGLIVNLFKKGDR